MKKLPLLALLVLFSIFGCDDEPNLNPEGFTESLVNINGNWKIQQVLQNGIDITSLLDFGSFSLQFNYDNGEPSSYVLSNLTTPFVLKATSGSWTFDDPTYPKKINFSDGSSLSIEGSVLSGGNELTLRIPLGCTANAYVYKLIK